MAAINLVREDGRTENVAPKIKLLEENISHAIWGKTEAVRIVIAALLARGHVLIEDVPGVGKTTLARALARSLGCSFRRIQFTSDLLPSDVLGVSVFRNDTREFDFREGPIFANIVLADEVNRTTPRTQSCLLEAMNEGRVSLEGRTHALPSPFMVIATQNPYEFHGTYPLPESQLDRFLLRIRLGYPSEQVERQILLGLAEDTVETLSPVLSLEDVLGLQNLSDQVKVDSSIADYIVRLARETRRSQLFELGISTRGARALLRAARAFALIEGRSYCIPDDVKRLAVAAFAHRVVLSSYGDPMGVNRDEGERAIQEILDRVPVPA